MILWALSMFKEGSFMLKRARLKIVFLTTLCFFSDLVSENSCFENECNHFSGNSIQKIRIMGERCSGTTYIKALLEKNFPEQHVVGYKKHFMPWFDLNAFNIPKKTKEKQDFGFLSESTASSLVVLVVRDPYDWLRSFYSHPWHVSSDKMLHKGFLHFLKHEWRASDKDMDYVGVDHWNPYEARRFKNVLELRKYKTLNYLQIGLLCENFLVAPYEVIAENPEKFIDFVCENFALESVERFKNIYSYKNENKKPYIKSTYKDFKFNELIFINQQMDWDVESLVGYKKIEKLKEINER